MTGPRISLPGDAWPPAERLAWEQATTAVDLLATGDPASEWRPTTRRHAEESYGCWLAWLYLIHEFDLDEGPADRLTHSRLGEYILHMQARLAPATVVTRLVGLERAISVLDTTS